MKNVVIIILLSVCTLVSQAQDLDKLLQGGAENGNKLLQNYLAPAFIGMGYSMNSGWYNTGKPHKLLGIDITATVTGAYVPKSDLYFRINPADYKNLGTSPAENGQDKFPTIMGPNLDADDIPYLVFDKGTKDEFSTTGPTGLGLKEAYNMPNVVPGVAIQAGIGLIKNTELKVRYMPNSSFGKSGQQTDVSMFGLGVMHDVKQWIPGIKNLPFDLSGLVAFSSLNASQQINKNSPDQIVEMNISGTTVQGIISKKLAILTVYGGVGFMTSKINFKMLGNYNIDGVDEDPIDFDYKNGGLRANVGARLKLLIFTFHAEYALQEYNTVSGGVGISIR